MVQNMDKKINVWESDALFVVPFWKTKIDNFTFKKKSIEKVLSTHREKPTQLQTFTSNRGSDFIKPFREIFQEELNGFANTIKKHCEITDVWSTSYKTYQYHPYHNHGDVGLSGIIYLDLKEKMPNTVFVNSNPIWITGQTQYYDMAVEEGDMVILPSHVGHFTAPNLSKRPKRIIAFDLNVIADTQ